METKKGFTLIELLIVVVIIAILSVALVFVLNPAETLRKARDAQRFSDLSILKNSIAIYVTTKSEPYLGGASDNTACKSTPTASWTAGDKIFYSVVSPTITDTTLDGGSGTVVANQPASVASSTMTDGTGWVPVNLASMVGGSPISNLPIDPVNTIASAGSVTNSDKVYRYACEEQTLTFEINGVLESNAFTIDDDKRVKDGGNNSNFFEAGTNLQILGSGTDF